MFGSVTGHSLGKTDIFILKCNTVYFRGYVIWKGLRCGVYLSVCNTDGAGF